MQTIEDQITEILRSATMSQGDNLLGFYYDIEYGLSHEKLANIEVSMIDDPRCLLIATGDATSELPTPKEIADYLVGFWLERLCYQDFEAHEIIPAPQSVTLRFITRSYRSPLCVTGKIVITHNYKDD